VIAAVRAQNAQVAVGQLGGTPSVPGQQINATVTAQGRLESPDQFRAIVVRSQADGSTVKLGDVARVEVGAENYDVIARYNGQPATGIAINLATGANALDTAKRVEALVKRLEPSLPRASRPSSPSTQRPS
jgi:multidrug efflux pump